MKLSIFTTITDPISRGDNYIDAINCYASLADEVIVVDGSLKESISFPYKNVKVVYREWPREFDWGFIGKQFQKGYESSTGHWVIHADIDFLFHDRDMQAIRQVLERNSDKPAMSFYKWQFILPGKYNLKSRLVVAVNKGAFGDRIRFDSGGDLCQPSLDGMYMGLDQVAESRLSLFNYEHLLKTKEQIMDDVGRMDRAYHRLFGRYQYGVDGTDESAYEGWYHMVKGRYQKPQAEVKINEHPSFIRETLHNLRPDQFGYNGFGLEVRDA